MSSILNSRNVALANVTIPELNLANQRKYVSLKGSLVTSSQVFTTPNPTTSSIQITCTPPSAEIAISRHILKRFKYQVNLVGTNTSGSPTLLQPGFAAPRCFPIMSTTTSESMTINNNTVTQSPVNQIWPAFLQYANCFDNRFGQFSSAPSMLDNFQDYSLGVGSNLNPLLGYAESSYELGRGASVGFAITANTATTATVIITSTEPVLLSPFCFADSAYNTPALIGVNSMTYYATLGNINRVMSLIVNQGISGIAITSLTTQVLSAELEFKYLTPDPIQQIPKTLVSSYYSIVDFPTQSNQTVAPGGTISIPMSSVQLSGIPKRVFLYATQNNNVIAADTLGALSDVYLSFAQTSPLVMTWNNNQYFASYTTPQLYDLAVKNGCNESAPQWYGTVESGVITGGNRGSVLCIEFGEDVGLAANEAPGKQGNYQLQFVCNFLNTNPSRSFVSPQLHCVVIYEGIFTVANGFCTSDINVLSGDDILAAQRLAPTAFMPPKNVYGGQFWEGFAEAFGKVNDFLKKSKIISTTLGAIPHRYAQVAAPIVSSLGYGKKRGAALSGGARRRTLRSRVRGGGLCETDHEDGEVCQTCLEGKCGEGGCDTCGAGCPYNQEQDEEEYEEDSQ